MTELPTVVAWLLLPVGFVAGWLLEERYRPAARFREWRWRRRRRR